MTLRRLTDRDLTPAIIEAAKVALKELYPKAIGAEKLVEIDGKRYVARLEQHYHEPGGKLKPWGYHKGISMFAVVDGELAKDQSMPPAFDHRIYSFRNLHVPVDFLQAAEGSYSKGPVCVDGRAVRLLVLHCDQGHEVPTEAEALAFWSNGKGHPKASWNFAVDCNSISQSVEVADIAWHAGIVNPYSIGIEAAGKAEQSRAQWNDAYSQQVLENTSRLLAVLASLEWYDLPLEHVTQNLEVAFGVCTHWDITRWFKVKGGHYDPGPNYPIDQVLARARQLQLEAVSNG